MGAMLNEPDGLPYHEDALALYKEISRIAVEKNRGLIPTAFTDKEIWEKIEDLSPEVECDLARALHTNDADELSNKGFVDMIWWRLVEKPVKAKIMGGMFAIESMQRHVILDYVEACERRGIKDDVGPNLLAFMQDLLVQIETPDLTRPWIPIVGNPAFDSVVERIRKCTETLADCGLVQDAKKASPAKQDETKAEQEEARSKADLLSTPRILYGDRSGDRFSERDYSQMDGRQARLLLESVALPQAFLDAVEGWGARAGYEGRIKTKTTIGGMNREVRNFVLMGVDSLTAGPVIDAMAATLSASGVLVRKKAVILSAAMLQDPRMIGMFAQSAGGLIVLNEADAFVNDSEWPNVTKTAMCEIASGAISNDQMTGSGSLFVLLGSKDKMNALFTDEANALLAGKFPYRFDYGTCTLDQLIAASLSARQLTIDNAARAHLLVELGAAQKTMGKRYDEQSMVQSALRAAADAMALRVMAGAGKPKATRKKGKEGCLTCQDIQPFDSKSGQFLRRNDNNLMRSAGNERACIHAFK